MRTGSKKCYSGVVTVFVLFLFLSCFIQVAESLKCHQCLTCPDKTKLSAATECSADAKSCIKTIKDPNSAHETVSRGCSTKNPKEQSDCQPTICIYHCSGDGCNSGTSVMAVLWLSGAMVALATLLK